MRPLLLLLFILFLLETGRGEGDSNNLNLKEFLNHHRLAHHFKAFVDHGFSHLDDFAHIDGSDLLHVGVLKRGEQKRAIRAATTLRSEIDSPTTSSSTTTTFSSSSFSFYSAIISLFDWSNGETSALSLLPESWLVRLFFLVCMGLILEMLLHSTRCFYKVTQLAHSFRSSCGCCSSDVVIHVPRDYSTVEEAVERAKQSRGEIQVIRIAAGRYVLQSELLIDFNSGVKLAGAGMGVTTLVGLIVIKQARDIELNGMTVMSGTSFQTVGGCGLRVGSGGSALVTSCEVKCCRGCGVEVRGKSFLSMTNLYVHHNGWSGVIVIGDGTRATFENLESNHNERCGLSAMNGAVVDVRGKRTSIHHNDGPGVSSTGAGAMIRIHLPRTVECIRDNGTLERKEEVNEGDDRETQGNILYDDGGSVQRIVSG